MPQRLASDSSSEKFSGVFIVVGNSIQLSKGSDANDATEGCIVLASVSQPPSPPTLGRNGHSVSPFCDSDAILRSKKVMCSNPVRASDSALMRFCSEY